LGLGLGLGAGAEGGAGAVAGAGAGGGAGSGARAEGGEIKVLELHAGQELVAGERGQQQQHSSIHISTTATFLSIVDEKEDISGERRSGGERGSIIV